MFRADLHCHTTCSDGSLTPAEIIQLAKQEGLSGLSITDHDSISAYETAIPLAKEAGILLGTGVEFSCEHRGVAVHVLGYDYSLSHTGLIEFCAAHQKRRQKRNRAILAKLKQAKILIDESELEELEKKENTVGRPHIAQLMFEKRYVSSPKEAFDLYIGEGKRCFDPGANFSVEETIELIHAAGGKAFLAHPHLMEKSQVVRELLKMNFDGIECYYSRCLPNQERRWLKLAKEKGRLTSGGSDFHGSSKPHIPLGCSWVNETVFHQIFQHVY